MSSPYIHVATIGKPHGIKGGLSIHSKLEPAGILFEQELLVKEDTSFVPFPITSHEQHHNKAVFFSPLSPDRNHANHLVGTLIYCQEDILFQHHPEQILYDLCSGYQVHANDQSLIGTLEYVEEIQNIAMASVTHDQQKYKLPLDIQDIDHEKKILTLGYKP